MNRSVTESRRRQSGVHDEKSGCSVCQVAVLPELALKSSSQSSRIVPFFTRPGKNGHCVPVGRAQGRPAAKNNIKFVSPVAKTVFKPAWR